MPELSEDVTVRRLPDGVAQPARMAKPDRDHLTVCGFARNGDGLNACIPAGAMVEVEASQAIYLGVVVSRPPDSSGTDCATVACFTVAVEHFIDRAALAQIDTAWKTAPGA